jgi:hypothetical protein
MGPLRHLDDRDLDRLIAGRGIEGDLEAGDLARASARSGSIESSCADGRHPTRRCFENLEILRNLASWHQLIKTSANPASVRSIPRNRQG